MKFDARTAKLLAPGEHLTIDGCDGLRLEASSAGHAWIYRFKSPIDKRMRQTKIGNWPAISVASAIVQWEALRRARKEGKDPAQERRRAREAAKAEAEQARVAKRNAVLTVRKVCEIYLTGHVEVKRKDKGAKEARRMFDTMLGPFAEEPAATFTRAQAFDLLSMHSKIPVQQGRLRAELGSAWDYALDAGRLPETAPNWWRQIMRGRIRSKGKVIGGKNMGTTKRILTNAELAVLIPWLPNFSRNVEDALTLYLWTGTRGSEIVSMEAREIGEEDGILWWTIPKAKTKNERHEKATDLRVPLIGRAADIVRRRFAAARNGFLFWSMDKRMRHINQSTITLQVWYHQPYCETRPEDERPRLPVTYWAPHDLRRTARTMLASMGCPEDVAESVLGHMLPGVKGVYNLHDYDKERLEWLTKLAERLEQIASGR